MARVTRRNSARTGSEGMGESGGHSSGVGGGRSPYQRSEGCQSLGRDGGDCKGGEKFGSGRGCVAGRIESSAQVVEGQVSESPHTPKRRELCSRLASAEHRVWVREGRAAEPT